MATVRRLLFLSSLSLTVLLFPSRAFPQSSPVGDVEPLVFPRLMAGAGIGRTSGSMSSPALTTLSLQFLQSRHLSVEADVSYWAEEWNNRHPGNFINRNGQPIA